MECALFFPDDIPLYVAMLVLNDWNIVLLDLFLCVNNTLTRARIPASLLGRAHLTPYAVTCSSTALTSFAARISYRSGAFLAV